MAICRVLEAILVSRYEVVKLYVLVKKLELDFDEFHQVMPVLKPTCFICTNMFKNPWSRSDLTLNMCVDLENTR